MDIATLLGNAASGGILGALGSVASGIVSIFQQKAQFAHDEAMGALALQQIGAQSDANAKLSAEQLKIVTEQGANQAFVASQSAATFTGASPFAQDLLALWRPILTAGLIAYSFWMFPRVAPEVQTQITQAYVMAGTTAIAWWFGSRQIEKGFPAKKPAAAKTATAVPSLSTPAGGTPAAAPAADPAIRPAVAGDTDTPAPAPTPHQH